MEGTSKLPVKSERDIFYYRQRFKNRLHEAITAFFAEEAERRGITKQDIAESIGRDPAQITRWLSAPNNMTAETISDLLFSLDAEMDPSITRFAERGIANDMHPLMQRIIARRNGVVVPMKYDDQSPVDAVQKATEAGSSASAKIVAAYG